MSHKNKRCLRDQAKERFENLKCFGRSKYEDKKQAAKEYDLLVRSGKKPDITKQEYINNALRDKIYSIKTYGTYAKHNNYFFEYCEKEHGCKTLAQCRQYADEWLQKRIDAGLSASTIAMEKAGLGKLYGESAENFIKTPERRRSDITRSRGYAKRDAGFSLKNNAEIVDFARATGLRRSELAGLKGNQLKIKGDEAYLCIYGKGGRYREAPIIGSNKQAVIDRCKAAGDSKVWDSVPSHMDVHSYRSDYATAIYTAYARPIDELKDKKWYNPKTHKEESALYHFRSDRKGLALDKEAMLKASEALGHSRIDVVGAHYIR